MLLLYFSAKVLSSSKHYTLWSLESSTTICSGWELPFVKLWTSGEEDVEVAVEAGIEPRHRGKLHGCSFPQGVEKKFLF